MGSGGEGRSVARRMGPRVALAGTLTALMLAAAAALGTTSYAGNGHDSAAGAQYDNKVLICHRSEDSPAGETLRVSADGAKAHLREHDDDTAGPCA